MKYKNPELEILNIEQQFVLCASNDDNKKHDNGNHNGFDHSEHNGYDDDWTYGKFE